MKFDYGAVVDGYCSDFGRTIFCGEPSDEFVATYDEVLIPAHEAAIAACVPGARAGDVDLICRKVIEDAGLGEAFIHRAGHCLGLDLHERPYISEEDDLPLEEGMVFTIEPSINVPGRMGMRIEDMVVCEPGGGRNLVDVVRRRSSWSEQEKARAACVRRPGPGRTQERLGAQQPFLFSPIFATSRFQIAFGSTPVMPQLATRIAGGCMIGMNGPVAFILFW